METPVYRGTVRLGSGVGDHLRQRVKRAQRSIYVLSPYLSGSFVADLVAAHKRGVQVHLLTSDSDSLVRSLQQKELYRHVLDREIVRDAKRTTQKAAALIISTGVLLLSLAGGIMVSPLLFILSIASLVALLLSLRMKTVRATYKPLLAGFAVFCSEEGVLPASSDHARKLVHAKAYIIDGKAYLGSLNFTYRGFHENYESLIEVQDEAAVRKLEQELLALEASTEYSRADVDALGDLLYRE